MQPLQTKTTVHMVEISRYRKAENRNRRRDRDSRGNFVLETEIVFVSASSVADAQLQVQASYHAKPYEVSVIGDIDAIDQAIARNQRKVSDLKRTLHDAALRRNVWLKRRGQMLAEIGDLG